MFVYAHLCITLHNHTGSPARVKRCTKIITNGFPLRANAAEANGMSNICRKTLREKDTIPRAAMSAMKSGGIVMKRLGISVFLLLAMAWACAAQMAKSTAPAEIAIHAGKVLDVRTGNYLSDQTIWIEGDRIKAIGKTAEISSRLPAATKMIDLSNATVLPGLIDCHTHLTMTPYDAGPAGLHASYPRQALTGARNARVTLEAGFTTVRNVGASGYSDIALRDAIK